MTRLRQLSPSQKIILTVLFFLTLALLFLNGALLPSEGYALGAHDTSGLFIPWISYVKQSLSHGELPLWNPYEFAGYPFLSNPQVGFFYPLAWLTFLLPTNLGLSWYVLVHLWLAACGMFLFVRSMGGKWLGSILSGILYGFSGFMAARIWAGHFGVMASFAWLPWILLGIVWATRKKTIWSAVIAGLPIAMSFLAGHTPSFFYILLILGGFVVYLVLGERLAVGIVLRQLAIAMLVGIAVSAIQLLPFIQLSLDSQRLTNVDYNFATQYSFPPAHLPALLLPEFFGEPTNIGYWSVPSFEELTYYAGIFMVIGLALAIGRLTPLAWYYLILMVVGLWFAMGRFSPFYNILYDLLPPIRMMRAPGRAAVLFMFGAAALVGHAISTWEKAPLEVRESKLRPLIRWTLLITATVAIAALAATAAIFMIEHPTDTSGRLWHQVGGYALAILILLLGGAFTWGYLSTPSSNRRRRFTFAIALIILVVADLFQFGAKLVQLQEIKPNSLWEEANNIVDKPTSRILPWGVSIFEQKGASEYQLASVFGYEALEPASLISLTSNVPDPRAGAYDVLAVGHVLSPVPLEQYEAGEKGLELVGNSGGSWIYRRPNALPIARLAFESEVIPDEATAINRINDPEFDVSRVVILESHPDCDLQGQAPGDDGSVEILETGASKWRLQTVSNRAGILVLAESYYPGWRATIDGDPIQTLRAYTTLRAICVPAGEHIVEWSYLPSTLVLGALITILTLGALIAVALYRTVAAKRSEKGEVSNQEQVR